MKKQLWVVFIVTLLAGSMAVSSCSDDSCEEEVDYTETFTQVSTIDAILEGIYDGVISFSQLKEYGDFGIGTFEGLDGEMVAIDGDFYQIKADGVAYEVPDSMTTPFAQVVFFDVDKTLELGDETTFKNLGDYVDNELPTENIFYAIKIEGTFDYMKTRSVPGQTKPYPPLVEVTANQPTFEFNDVKGTIIGFKCPPYMDGVGVPGYHLHFLTEDRKAGGHILEIDVADATATFDFTSEYFMILPDDSSDFYDIDLSKDMTEELEEAEQ